MSGCGKTTFTTRLLLDNADLFSKTPEAVHYCYGSWQKGFQKLKEGGVKFHEGIADSESLPKWFPEGQGILVLDDLMDEEATTNACWIYSLGIHITKVSRCFTYVRISFRTENTPRPSLATLITSRCSRTHEINWG